MLCGVTVVGCGRVAAALEAAFEEWGVPARTCPLAEAGTLPGHHLAIALLDSPEAWTWAARPRRHGLWVVAAAADLERALALGADETLTRPLRLRTLAALVEIWAGRGQLARACRALDVGLELADPDGRLFYVNPAWEARTGWRRPEVVGRTPGELLRSPLVSDDHLADMWTTLTEGRSWAGPHLSRDRAGADNMEQVTVTPVPGGGDTEFLAVVRQPHGPHAETVIAELRSRIGTSSPESLLRRLRSSQSKYRALFAWAVDAILIADFDTARIVEANDAARRMFGYSDAEFLAMKGRRLVAPCDQDKVEALSRYLRERGWCVAPKLRCVRKDGSEFWGTFRILVFHDGEQRYEVSMCHDITDQVKQEQGLAAESRLAAAGRVAAGVAHDLNNPAAYVQLNLGLVRELLAGASLPAEVVEELDAILADCDEGMQRIQASTAELASLARAARSEPGPVQLDEVVQAAARMAMPVVRHRAQLSLGILPRLVVEGHRDQLLRVVSNLLLNAAEAMEEGPAASQSIVVELRHLDGHALLTVEDTGRGMDAGLLERVFEPFVSTKATEGGSGLGLWLVQQMVERHQGTVLVNSEPGEGTRVAVRIPARLGVVKPAAVPGTVALPGGTDDRPRILVIDDERGIRSAFRRTLSRVGEVVLAIGGRQAQELLRQDTDFDAIVCDLMMPDLDGRDLYLWMAHRYPALAQRLVFCTGGSMAPKSTRFLDQVDNRVLQKPLDPATLREAVLEVAFASRSSRRG